MKNKYALIGTGGHSKVLHDIVCLRNMDIACLVVPDHNTCIPEYYSGYSVLSDSEFIKKFKPDDIHLILGIGMLPKDSTRKDIYLKYNKKGYQFPAIIHPLAVIANNVVLEEGCQIMAGVIIQPASKIGRNSIINTASSIDHDVTIGANCHIAPGATICGEVNISNDVFVGSGSIVINGVHVNNNVVINAGAVVKHNI